MNKIKYEDEVLENLKRSKESLEAVKIYLEDKNFSNLKMKVALIDLNTITTKLEKVIRYVDDFMFTIGVED